MTQHGSRRGLWAAILAGLVAGVIVASTFWYVRDADHKPTSQAASAHDAVPVADGASAGLIPVLAKSRAATGRYATSLRTAQADGYKVITPMMADMGVHYLNPDVKGFDPEKPPILVYVGNGDTAQLVALEWVFPQTPATPPLPGATYGSFDAACHYADGQFIAGDEASCAKNHPVTNAPFFFWHPTLVTLHVWLWYPNPDGIFHSTNSLVRPYNKP
jgi:hypothetical protein